MVNKYVREDGMVAILYSPGFGAGWYTWNPEYPNMIFDREIAEAILNNDRNKAKEIASTKWPKAYLGGYEDLEIYWLEPGTAFTIEEYDGSESIRIYCDLRFVA